MARSLLSLGNSAFGAALGLLPRWLREPFADDMYETFAARQRAAAADGGAWRALRVTLVELGGVVRLAAQARMRGQALLALDSRGGGTASPGAPGDPSSGTSRTMEYAFMDTLLQDIRYTVRGLRKSPGFTAVAVITLALGIGVNTTIFSIVNSTLLRPLPVEEPGELIDVYGQSARNRGSHNSSAYLNYVDLRERSDTLEGLFGYTNFIGNFVEEGRNELIVGELVTEGYFETLGIQPALGRTFSADEFATEGTHPVVILGDLFWKSRYGGDPDILGREIRISGNVYTVVGVAPPEFSGMFPAVSAPMWVPVNMTEALEPLGNNGGSIEEGRTRRMSRGANFLWMRGRLRDGVTLEEARAELTGIMAQLEEEYPETNEFVSVAVLRTQDVRFNPDVDGLVAPAGALILGVVGLVLLVACANIANMLLARASTRRKEVAIRLAIGAGRGRLIRQLLTESMMLSAFGGALGLVLTLWLTRFIANVDIPIPIDMSFDFRLDTRVLAFASAVSLATGVAFGLVPALRASRPDLVPALKDGGGEAAGKYPFELRNALVVVQVAVSVVLLIGGALMVRSFVIAQRIDVGYDVDRIAMLGVGLEAVGGYDQETGETLLDTAKLRLQETPGVLAVSMSSRVPLSVNDNTFGVYIDGHQTSNADSAYAIGGAYVDPDYFDSLDVSIVQGRNFVAADGAEDRRVTIINQAMAELYWPGESALGKVFYQSFGGRPLEIVGVVEDYKVDTPGEAPTPYLHRPFSHNSSLYAVYLIRTEAPAAGEMARLEQVFYDLDPRVAFMQRSPLRDNLDVRLLPVKLGAWMIGAFAMLALTLAVVGLYGVIGYSVSRRTREIGIRVALGAESAKVLRLVVVQGMTLVLIGGVIGAVAAAFVGNLLASVLYGISAVDPLAFGGAIGTLVLFALVANYIPARRAARVDPMIALRSE